MMRITMDSIKSNFNFSDFSKGFEYFNLDRVYDYEEAKSGNKTIIKSKVSGKYEYAVEISYDKNDSSMSLYCDCADFEKKGSCKHIVATLLTYEGKHRISPSTADMEKTNFGGKTVLNEYLKKADKVDSQEKMSLIPTVKFNGDKDYPSFFFRVGRDKMYVIKNMEQFIYAIINEENIKYGKDLEFVHSRENFDEKSQKIIDILLNKFYCVYRSFSDTLTARRPVEPYSGYRLGNEVNSVKLTGQDFDIMFDIFKGQVVASKNDADYLFKEENICTKIKVTQKGKSISINFDDDYSYFGDFNTLYCVDGNAVYRCDKSFKEKVYPLFKALDKTVVIGEGDIPTFCSCVLPEIKEYVAVEDEKNILMNYLPDELTTQFYFDITEDGALICRVNFVYGETVIEDAVNNNIDYGNIVKRDYKSENEKLAVLRRYFHEKDSSYESFYQTDEDIIYYFITESIQSLYDYGEIYITDKLSRLDMPKPKVNIGLSVANGIINLNIDTGEFPKEELEELFQALTLKKKYYKLRDGRFMSVQGTSFEKLAEIQTMLHLDRDEFSGGQIKLPEYRAPYLDEILSEEGIEVIREKSFKNFLESFKNAKDSDYDIPDNFENVLRPYQKIGFKWLKTLDSYGFGGILADDMGLGKTIQILAYLQSLKKGDKPSLIVCPSSLILNWVEESEKYSPGLKLGALMGNAQSRGEIMSNYRNFDVMITSYELLRRDIEIMQGIPFYACILDESQYIKNKTTQISKTVKFIKAEKRFALTGTPIENRLSELWNIFDFLMPGYLYSHSAFVNKLEKPIIKQGNMESMDKLSKLVKPFILRRMKKDVLKDLPPKTEHTHKIQMDEEQRRVYLAAVNHAQNEIAMTNSSDKIKIFALLTRLRQICCDPRLAYENYSGESAKLEACLELCTNAVSGGHRILLFSQFTSMLSIIKNELDSMGISNDILQGSVPKEKRAELVKSFNSGEFDIFLISLKAGGTGLNLTAADIVIHYDPWWNIAAQNQATDRAYRIGQKNNVQVYRLIAKDSIEENIIKLQEKKRELLDAVTGQAEGDIMSMSKEDILELLK